MITRRQFVLSAAASENRLARGEDEHLIYYTLQANAFTRRPRIEPALVARDEHARAPEAVLARMRDLLAALEKPSRDPRLRWWRENLPADRRTLAGLETAFREAMRFLREKEFGGGGPEVYQKRGHSSDTSLAPCFTVWSALAVVRALDPAVRVARALIVGPGLDFAPRTGLREDISPQSYQPYLTARALLEWKLAVPGRLEIDCVDINPRVVRFIADFRGALVLPPETGNADFTRYVRALGSRVEAPPARIRAFVLDIVSRPPETEAYDLAVATNVLIYFSAPELKAALANIDAALKPGGWLIHNEIRPELEEVSRVLAMPPVQARTIEIARGTKAPLLDAFVLHRKAIRR